MEYTAWAPYYERIRADFGFAPARERASADLLLFLLPESSAADPLAAIAGRLAGRDAIVVGLAPGWGPPPIWTLPQQPRDPALVAADGAAASCLDAGLVPTVITTDLDGPVPSELAANAKGACVVVHAHGDNGDALRRWVPEFQGELLGSWAGPPEPHLLDVGGFTDGDRGAYLAEAAGARRILLWAFDFGNVEAEPSESRGLKGRKLAWAREVLGVLAKQGRSPIFTWRRDGTLLPYDVGNSAASTQ